LKELTALVEQGYRAALVYCVQRADVSEVRPANEIDPAYCLALRLAVMTGVEVYAYRADISPHNIRLSTQIQVSLG